MEIGNIKNHNAPQKTEEPRRTASFRKSVATTAYAAVGSGDSVDVSTTAKLLQRLRESYEKLSAEAVSTETRNTLSARMSSETIVDSILDGALIDKI